MHSQLSKLSLASAGSIVFGATGVLTFCLSARDWPSLSSLALASVAFEALRLILIDAPILILGFWLLREMRPAAFSARLLLVPAVTLLEGIVAERPQVGWYGWLGLALMVGAAAFLVASTGDKTAIHSTVP
jgi:hypothetical protein